MIKRKGMVSVNYKILLMGLIFMVATLLYLGLTADTVFAAEEVVKVEHDYQYKDNNERIVVKGLDKNGNAVWTYRSSYTPASEIYSASCMVKGSRVYVVSRKDGLKVMARQTGKVIYTNDDSSLKISAAAMDADSNKSLYVSGYGNGELIILNSKGKIARKYTLPSYYLGVYKLKVSGSKLKLYCEAYLVDDIYNVLMVSTKKGVIISESVID